MKILAKRKRGNKFPLEGKRGGRQLEAREKQNKRGNKSKDLLGKSWPCDSKGIKGNFAHEYVILYKRGLLKVIPPL